MPFITSNWQSMAKFTKAAGDAKRGCLPRIRIAMLQSTALIQGKLKEAIMNPGGGFGALVAGKAGKLLDSWQPSITEGGKKGSVTSSKLYSSVMDQGRRPGSRQPPTEAIENWIRDKRIVEDGLRTAKALGGALRGGQRLKRRASLSKATQKARQERFTKGLAFVIARSIGRKGIVGRRYVSKALGLSSFHLQNIWNAVADYTISTLTRGGA